MATEVIYTDISELPLDEYLEQDNDDSIHANPIETAQLDAPRMLSMAGAPLATYVPHPRTFKKNAVGKDCFAVKRALSVAGFGKWGYWGAGKFFFGEAAVKNLNNFQEKKGLKVTGTYNDATHQKLGRYFDDYGRFLMGEAKEILKPDPYKTIVNTAMYGYTKRDTIHYTQGWLRMEGVKNRLKPPAYPHWEDCSSFATWCYWVAGLKDPNGLNYNGWGYTGTLIQHGKRISVVQLKPGDLVFYGRHGISHVAIYVGNGRVVSHGSESGPLLLSTYYRSDLQYAISYWR